MEIALLVVVALAGGLVAFDIAASVAWWRLRRRLARAERQESDLTLETRASRLRIEQLEAQVRRLRAVLLGQCPACSGSGRCAPCDGTGEVAKLPSGSRRS
jgi:hypothetical protein